MYKHLWLFVILILNAQFVISQSQQQLFTEFCDFIEEQTGKNTFKQNSLSSINKANNSYFKKVDKLTLDSIETSYAWDSQVLESYTYDDFGNQTSIAQNFATTGTIVKLEFEYDDNANITDLRYCLRDSTYQMLSCLLKGEYFYEDEKIVHNELYREYKEDTTSVLVSRNTYEYDNKDRIEHIEHFRTDSLGNEKLDYHFQYIYEPNKITPSSSNKVHT